MGFGEVDIRSWQPKKITITPEAIQQLIDERNIAKKNKLYEKADTIRSQLIEKGVVIEDSASETFGIGNKPSRFIIAINFHSSYMVFLGQEMIEGASLDQIDQLNPQQKEVVCSPFSHHLVLAGAGSGKTRVLVSRIVWIVSQKQVSPYNVMAVTFTNKAASELRTRVESALGARLQEIWIGTFHSICHRILRFHAKEADLTSSFQIMDSDDQQRLIKKIHKEFNMDEDKWPK